MVELVHPQEFDPEWEMRQAALAAEISRLDVPLTPQLLQSSPAAAAPEYFHGHEA